MRETVDELAVYKSGYMLETPSIRRYSFISHRPFTVDDMSSDKPFGADNQQGRLESYLSGFADGEGSFSVGLSRRPDLEFGFQLVPSERVIPFFIRNPLLSSKSETFEHFATIVHAMEQRQHLTSLGFERLVTLAFRMNGGGRYRKWTIEDVLGTQNPQRLYARQGPQSP